MYDQYNGFRRGTCGETLTSSATAADGVVGWVLRVSANVADARIENLVLSEVVAVHVLDSPEASGGQGGLLRAFWHSHCCGCLVEARRGEWSG